LATTTAQRVLSTRKPLHIIQTKFLEGNEVLVHFSDGSSALYEAEELEKLRPSAKKMFPAPALHPVPIDDTVSEPMVA